MDLEKCDHLLLSTYGTNIPKKVVNNGWRSEDFFKYLNT